MVERNGAPLHWREQRAVTVVNICETRLVIVLLLGTSQLFAFCRRHLRVMTRFPAALAVGQIALVFHNRKAPDLRNGKCGVVAETPALNAVSGIALVLGGTERACGISLE